MPRVASVNFRDFSGGANTRDRPLGIEETELHLSENMESQKNGEGLKGRRGQAEDFDITAISAVKSIFTWYLAAGTRVTVAFGGTSIYNAEDGTERDTSLTSALKWSTTSWSTKDKAYYTNGTDAVQKDDGTTIAALGGTPPTFKYIEFHFDRLWLAEDSTARFSDLNDDETWPAANALNLGDRFGGIMTGMKSFGGNMIFLKDTGLYRFEGSPILGGTITRFIETFS